LLDGKAVSRVATGRIPPAGVRFAVSAHAAAEVSVVEMSNQRFLPSGTAEVPLNPAIQPPLN